MHEVPLRGIDGTNPLGFLASLGVLEAVSSIHGDAKLAWRYEGAWRPTLTSSLRDLDALLGELDADRRRCADDPALALEYDGKRDLKPRPEQFRTYLLDLRDRATRTDSRTSVDWASAFATDVAVDNNGNTKPTALHFTAGQQQFLQMVRELVGGVTRDDLAEAVEGPWRYERPLPVMGWDGTSSRDYALRASNPSTDKKLGVPGADWLAVRGLSLLPVFPRRSRILTSGCVGGWKDGRFRWPLWTVALTRSVVRTLLGLDVEGMQKTEREARGIGIVLTSGIKRSDQGGYGSFEPASVV